MLKATVNLNVSGFVKLKQPQPVHYLIKLKIYKAQNPNSENSNFLVQLAKQQKPMLFVRLCPICANKFSASNEKNEHKNIRMKKYSRRETFRCQQQ